jgi:hypothetical protein
VIRYMAGEAAGLHSLVAVLGTDLGTERGEHHPNKRDMVKHAGRFNDH